MGKVLIFPANLKVSSVLCELSEKGVIVGVTKSYSDLESIPFLTVQASLGKEKTRRRAKSLDEERDVVFSVAPNALAVFQKSQERSDGLISVSIFCDRFVTEICQERHRDTFNNNKGIDRAAVCAVSVSYLMWRMQSLDPKSEAFFLAVANKGEYDKELNGIGRILGGRVSERGGLQKRNGNENNLG